MEETKICVNCKSEEAFYANNTLCIWCWRDAEGI